MGGVSYKKEGNQKSEGNCALNYQVRIEDGC